MSGDNERYLTMLIVTLALFSGLAVSCVVPTQPITQPVEQPWVEDVPGMPVARSGTGAPIKFDRDVRFSQPVEMYATLDVDGTATVGNLTVEGSITTADVTIPNNVNITGTLAISGTIEAGDGGDTITINSSDWDIGATGAMTGIGAITADGLITGSAGATISGATTSVNASSNFATNINTGTSAGALSLGGGSGTVAVDSTGWDISTLGAVSSIGDITAATGLSGGWDLAIAAAGANTAGQTIDIAGQAGGATTSNGVGKDGGSITITAGAGSAKSGSGANDGNGGDVVLLGGAKGGATGGSETVGAVLVGSPTLTTVKAANMLGVAGALEVDGTARFDGAVTATSTVAQTLVNSAGGSANPYDYTGTLGIFDGTDDFTLFDVNITNADHTGGTNTVQALDVAAITGDDQATETAINIGAGWDNGLKNASASALDGGITVDTANFTVNGTTGAVATLSTASVGTWVKLGAQTPFTVTGGVTITPTGTYQPISSASGVTCSTTTCIANGTTAGDLLILRNANVSDTITIDGTGGNVECKTDVVLGAGDTLSLIWNGTDWNCVAGYDNS